MCELLTIDELAAVLKVKKSWVYGHTKIQGPEAIPRVKVGKYLRFNMEDVMNWIGKKQERGISQ